MPTPSSPCAKAGCGYHGHRCCGAHAIDQLHDDRWCKLQVGHVGGHDASEPRDWFTWDRSPSDPTPPLPVGAYGGLPVASEPTPSRSRFDQMTGREFSLFVTRTVEKLRAEGGPLSTDAADVIDYWT